jgi:hypothetical protein
MMMDPMSLGADSKGRLLHQVPLWVDRRSAIFHVRLRVAFDNTLPLTDPCLAPQLLDSIVILAEAGKWWPRVFLLMPDHAHALLVFPSDRAMSRVIGDWKRWHSQRNDVRWQSGYFDHRVRNEEGLEEKSAYILNNPVAKGLCAQSDAWPWVVIEGKRRGMSG